MSLNRHLLSGKCIFVDILYGESVFHRPVCWFDWFWSTFWRNFACWRCRHFLNQKNLSQCRWKIIKFCEKWDTLKKLKLCDFFFLLYNDHVMAITNELLWMRTNYLKECPKRKCHLIDTFLRESAFSSTFSLRNGLFTA